MPVDAALAGVERVWTMGWPFWAKRRLRGFRLIATDVDCSVGNGPMVAGLVGALLLLLTGRPRRWRGCRAPGSTNSAA
jgi:hypothetical protein